MGIEKRSTKENCPIEAGIKVPRKKHEHPVHNSGLNYPDLTSFLVQRFWVLGFEKIRLFVCLCCFVNFCG